MTQRPHAGCPDDETLAAWVDGTLPETERAQLIAHASVCRECISMIDAANETFHAERGSVRRRRGSARWFLAVAAVLVLGVPAVFLWRSRNRDPLQDLVAIAPQSSRAVEARLSGGFPYAPYRGSMRAGGDAPDRDQMKVIGAASAALDRAERDPGPETRHAAGVAMLLVARTDEAIARLEAEAKRTPSDAPVWSDLAAAQYAAALAGRTSLYPEALASADRALRIDARSPEALFNRALILERLGLHNEARGAWQRYLDTDRSSEWANEAREHLARLAAAGTAPPFDADRQRLEQAAASGDEPLVRTLAGRHAERARAFGEAEYLGRWAEALQRNDAAEAARWLAVARNIGLALQHTSGESLLHDAVQAIDDAGAPRRARIAAAHLVYRRGRIAFSRHEPSAAERDLRLAAARFAEDRDPMSLAARSYAAGARLAQNDVDEARRELSALTGEVDAAHGYLSLAAQARWELARCLSFDGDFETEARVLGEAEALFARGGERVNQATVGSMLADALLSLGRPDEAWNAHVRAFATFTAAGRTDLLDAAVGAAALTTLRAGRMESTRALTAINESLERDLSNDLLLADTLVRKSLLDATIDPAAAERAASEATTVAMRIPEGALRARHLADADLAMAAALLGSDARRARDLASRAIDLYAAHGMESLIAEPYLVRARASLRLGETSAAERDLAAGIAAVEQHPAQIAGAVIGTGVLDAGKELFEDAIRLDLDRGDVASAFADAERRRGSAAGSGALGQLQARLAGSGTAVMTLIVLPREVVSLVITEGGAMVTRRAVAREELATLARRDDDEALEALYDLLVARSAPALAAARALVVIPDELLERVPFAALPDKARKQMLVERMPVALAPSAMALRAPASAVRPVALTALELPSGTRAGLRPLPEAEMELTAIGGLYRDARRIAPADVSAPILGETAADVLHIAGHTESDAAAGGEALALAGGAMSWRTIAAMRHMPRVVVLSACNTLCRPADADRRALSLGGAFVAAGARDVIGTLGPIGDADARTLFLALHQQLVRGVAPAAALRNVQLAQLRRPGGAWRRLALLTTTIHRATG